MNNEKILCALADILRPRLSDTNPLKGALYVTVAEPKENQLTFAVLQTAKTQARELVPGNYTWQYPCRLLATFYPPEGAYTPADINAWMEEAGLALVASCSALLQAPPAGDYIVLDAVVDGPLSWEPDDTGGYTGQVGFTLTVQF